MPEFHAEPYLHLAGLSHKSALVSWGAFYFKTRSRPSTAALGASAQWKLVEDRDLRTCTRRAAKRSAHGPTRTVRHA